MAMLPSQFNSEEHDDMGTFDALPAEVYTMSIVDSNIKPTKKALEAAGGNADLPVEQYSGLRLNLQFKIMGGEFDGRSVWNGLNIKNPNPQAVEISQKELATITRACGKVNVQDSAELHGIPLKVKLGIKPASAQYEAQNTFKSYEAHDGSPIQQAAAGDVKNPSGKKKLFNDDDDE